MNLPFHLFEKDPDKSFIVNYAPIFAGLSSGEKNLIIQKSKIVEYKKGDIIYRQRDPADAFYCLISGRIRIFTTYGTREETLEYLNCGKYFGIISLLTGEPHSVSAEASNDSKILRITKEDFQIILNKIPKLAIDLSKTLSRRLRKKDIVEKRVFESNILSVYSAMAGIGRTMYAVNLSLSLKKETNKFVILIDVSETAAQIYQALDIAQRPPLQLDTSFSLDEIIKNSIYQDINLGISILNVKHVGLDTTYAQRLNSLLTYLTAEYHYIIVDLPALMDEVVFTILGQSDIIHILTDYNTDNLEKTKALISDLFGKVKYPQERIKIIINAKKETKCLLPEEVSKILNYNISANLPVFWEIDERFKDVASQAILKQPQSEYSRAIRRIARELGDVRVGLALGGGAALGMAHIGVIKVLEEENIPVDIVAGSSMGALVGGLWASGLGGRQLEEIALEFNNNKKKVFRLLMDPGLPKLSFFKGRRIRAFLDKHIGNKTFKDIKFPFKVVACNISRRQELIFDSGKLTDAVMASIAIPGVFAPTKSNGDLVLDGGVVEAVPIGVLVKMGIKKIIAVNVLPSPENILANYEFNRRAKEEEEKLAKQRGLFGKIAYNLCSRFKQLLQPNILDIIVNCLQTMEYSLAEMDCQKADVLIRAVTTDVDWFEFFKAQAMIKKGEEAALRSLAEIKNLVSES